MVRNITIFATIFLIFALIFSFVAVRVLRTYDLSNVAKNGFAIPNDKEVRDATIKKVDSTIGYTSESDPSNPLVISAVLGTYPEEDTIPEEPITVPSTPTVEVITPEVIPPQPIEEITPPLVAIAPINDTLSVEVIIEKTPEEPIVDNTPKVREALSNDKSEARLVDMLNAISTKSDPKRPTMAIDTDASYAYMNSNDMIIAHQALREAALRSIYSIVKSDLSNEFVWKDSMENN